ncbi:solute carrier family 25 member 35-like isoform X2 [Pieris napi]|uniref:solute carrier family 25 member 35-like isoform X2 n=1 Tax=Pieris napi TaxID=78633 RepID=UPI001FB9C562|nr:solute carrier family 25 member 35-like isoform X2 [Pieris napi]
MISLSSAVNAMDFIIGGLAGAGATIFTNPMDVVKTRLQLQGELRSRKEQPRQYRGLFHGLYVIAKADGVLALQKGLTPAVVFGFCMNSVRLGTYHVAEVQGWTQSNGSVNVQKSAFWAGASGFMSGLAANPMSVVKTRLQAAAHPSVAVGRQHMYNGTIDALMKIYKTEGFRGFFAGVHASCIRLAIGSSAQLTTFSILKEQLLANGFCQNSPALLACVASLACGILSVLLETPLDVVTTRIFNQGAASKGDQLYKGVFDCLKKILKTEGVYGLYKGFGPLYLRIAPHTTLSLVIWDMLNVTFEKKR